MSINPLQVRAAIRRMRAEEQRLVLAIGAEVTKLAEPYFLRTQWEMLGWVFKRPNGTSRWTGEKLYTKSERKLRGGHQIESYCGICEHGVITDIWVGAVTVAWEDVFVEDALLILADIKQVVKRRQKGATNGR